VKRLAEPLTGLTGREAAFPNENTGAGSGEFEKSGDRSEMSVGPRLLISKRILCAASGSERRPGPRYRFILWVGAWLPEKSDYRFFRGLGFPVTGFRWAGCRALVSFLAFGFLAWGGFGGSSVW